MSSSLYIFLLFGQNLHFFFCYFSNFGAPNRNFGVKQSQMDVRNWWNRSFIMSRAMCPIVNAWMTFGIPKLSNFETWSLNSLQEIDLRTWNEYHSSSLSIWWKWYHNIVPKLIAKLSEIRNYFFLFDQRIRILDFTKSKLWKCELYLT